MHTRPRLVVFNIILNLLKPSQKGQGKCLTEKKTKTLCVFTQHFIAFHFRKEMILDKAAKESKSL